MPRRRNARSSALLSATSSFGHEVVECLDDRDLGAERLPDARELDADDAAAEDDRRARGSRSSSSAWSLGEDPAADLEARQRAAVRAGREDHVRAAVDVVADAHRRAGLEAALAGDDGDAAGLDEALEALVLLRDDALAVGADAGRVDALECGADADGRRIAGDLGDLGRVQQRLGRDAAAVQARAAHLVLLDEGDRLAELRRSQRRGVAAAAAAEDDEVERVLGHHALLSCDEADEASAPSPPSGPCR